MSFIPHEYSSEDHRTLAIVLISVAAAVVIVVIITVFVVMTRATVYVVTR